MAGGEDEIIVFDISNAVAVSLFQAATVDKGQRRVELMPEEWSDSFGEEFYDFSLQNKLYYIQPSSDWKAKEKGRPVSDSSQIKLLSKEELQMNMERIRTRAGVMDANG